MEVHRVVNHQSAELGRKVRAASGCLADHPRHRFFTFITNIDPIPIDILERWTQSYLTA